MIVATDALGDLAGTVSMVDGGFDPIHEGHVQYFAAAAALGDPVLCNVSPDTWVAQKHQPLLSQDRRVLVIDAFRDVTFVHLSTGTTVEVLRALRPKRYVKGMDWRERGLPAPEREACDELGIEVVYLDTVINSSSGLLRDFLDRSAEARA